MSFERTSLPGHAPGPSRSRMEDAIGPGKQTQVDMLPGLHGRASGSHALVEALGAAGADAAHGDHAAAPGHEAGGPHGAEHDEAEQEAGGGESIQLISEISVGGEGEAGVATGEAASDMSKPHAEHEEPLAHAASDTPASGIVATGRPIGLIDSATEKRAPDGAANNRTTVGVGEVVHLTSTEAGTWHASAGTLHGKQGKKVTWTAPATPTGAGITLHVAGQSATRPFTVIAPNSLKMVRFQVDSFPSGTQGAGMHTNVTVGPTSVCFGNVEWLEVGEDASNVTGYFKKIKPADLRHHPNPNWLPWNDQNTGLTDHASLGGAPKPWSAGGFQWNIPNKYRVTSVGGGGHVFTTTHQVFRMQKNGTTTITKGGASVTRSP